MVNKHAIIAIALCSLFYSFFTYVLFLCMSKEDVELFPTMLLVFGIPFHVCIDIYLLRLLYLYTKYSLIASKHYSFKEWCKKMDIGF